MSLDYNLAQSLCQSEGSELATLRGSSLADLQALLLGTSTELKLNTVEDGYKNIFGQL